jgi:hypothetical protein
MLPTCIRNLTEDVFRGRKRVTAVQRLQLAESGQRVLALPAPVEVLHCNTKLLRCEAKGALEKLLGQVFCDQLNWLQTTKMLLNSQSGAVVLVASLGSVVAAAVVECNSTPLECTVRLMATYPRERRRGFGRLLDCYVHLFAAQCGMQRVCVEVSQRNDGYSNAQSFWMQSCGYHRMSTGERSSAPCHACIFKGTELLARTVLEHSTIVRHARGAMQHLRARALC